MSRFSTYRKPVFSAVKAAFPAVRAAFPAVKAALLAGALAAAFAQPAFAQTERMMVGVEELTEVSVSEENAGAANGVDVSAETEEKELPSSVCLDVEELYQYPELPTGCESVALTALLGYYGFELEKTTIVDEYLPYSSNFAEGFDGNPYVEEGGGCYAPGIALAAQRYLDAQGSEMEASDVTGSTKEELYAYLADETPVLVWSTMYLSDSIPSGRVVVFDDTEYEWKFNEHCVVLTGYDLDQGIVYVTDPLEGNITRDAERFWELYEDMGSMAVVVE